MTPKFHFLSIESQTQLRRMQAHLHVGDHVAGIAEAPVALAPHIGSSLGVDPDHGLGKRRLPP
jgi:hypothetical protein